MEEPVEHKEESSSKPPLERRGGEIILRASSEITHRFVVEQTVDLSDFEQGPPFWVEAIDIADLSQFASAAREGLAPGAIKEQLEYHRNSAIRSCLEDVLETGQIEPVSTDIISQPYVYHAGCSLYTTPEGKPVDKLKAMEESGVYGGEDRVSYFGVRKYDALNHGLGNFNDVTVRGTKHAGARILMLTIDVNKLREKRNIFIDPETLLPALDHEFNRNFIVHKGIPVSAVKKLEILRYEGYGGEKDPVDSLVHS
jgi:hypothetical protein